MTEKKMYRIVLLRISEEGVGKFVEASIKFTVSQQYDIQYPKTIDAHKTYRSFTKLKGV